MLRSLGLLVGVALGFACAGSPARAQSSAAVDAEAPSSGPRIVTVHTPSERPTLVNGEQGVLRVELRLPPAWGGDGQGWAWDPDAGSVRLRLGAPLESGIGLLSGPEDLAEGGSRERLLFVPVPERAGEPLVVNVDYVVDSRARVETYPLRFDVAAPLRNPRGDPWVDVGTVELPVRVETPLATKLIVVAIILIAIFLFVVEWVRVDVVAILMMVSLPLLNLLSSRVAFTGLSSNAVVAIIGVMIVSAGLNKVGLVSRMVRPVINAAGSSPGRLMVMLSTLIALISSVMQNTGAAVLFLPGIRHACKQLGTPISRLLMPIGMCAILGGTLTMIGTSPLILLNDILPAGMERFSLLELTPIGAGFVIAGIIYFATGGRALLGRIVSGEMEGPIETGFTYRGIDGPFELQIPIDWRPGAAPDSVGEVRRDFVVDVVCLRTATGTTQVAPAPVARLEPGMSLGVYGPEASVKRFARIAGLLVREAPQRLTRLFNPAVAGTVEAVVTPHSSFVGRTIAGIGFRRTFGISPLALFQEGRTYYREMRSVPLISGDAILLHGTWEHLQRLGKTHRNFIYTEPLEVEIQKPEKVTAGVVCFLVTLAAMLVSSFYFQKLSYNPIPLSVCLMGGALLMVLTGVLNIREAYGAVDWRTVFLLGGLIPLGMAVDRTGTAQWIATGIVHALGDHVTPLILLTVLAVLSGAFCLVISNVGACTLLVPLAVSMATQIGIDPRVAAIVVGLGVSNSFLLPTHQVNALYMGPGGYRTKDYLKVGGIMSVIYVVVLVTMTHLFYL